MHSNKMNQYSFLEKRFQYDYLRIAIRKRKRFTKWKKKEQNLEKETCLKNIMEYYECSLQKAIEYFNIFTIEQINQINAIFASKQGVK